MKTEDFFGKLLYKIVELIESGATGLKDTLYYIKDILLEMYKDVKDASEDAYFGEGRILFPAFQEDNPAENFNEPVAPNPSNIMERRINQMRNEIENRQIPIVRTMSQESQFVNSLRSRYPEGSAQAIFLDEYEDARVRHKERMNEIFKDNGKIGYRD